jgi:DNA-binding transcriptional MerR regulator
MRVDAALRTCYKKTGNGVQRMPTAKRKHAKAQAEVVIPEKIYFRIGEVSELAALPTYVLRFWETEFSQLKPAKSSTGQRMYRRKDVEYVMQIRKLLYEDGFTIAGAREKLREEMRSTRSQNRTLIPVSSQASQETADAALSEAQTTLPFLAPLPGAHNSRDGRPAHNAKNKEELRRVRKQLCDVLNLLS